MTNNPEPRKIYKRLIRLHREIDNELVILQAVEGLGYMYDSTLYLYFRSLDRKLRRMEKTLKIRSLRPPDPTKAYYANSE
jgi:hypothetical protein